VTYVILIFTKFYYIIESLSVHCALENTLIIMPPREKHIGLEDIARESGYSISTVSLALRNKPGIPQETRQLVQETARNLGYRSRSSLPRRKPSQRPPLKNVGVVIKAQPDDFPQTNQFYSHVLVGIEAACRQNKLNLIMATILVDDFNHPVEVPSILQEGGVEGVLVIGAYLDAPILDILRRRSLPMVLVDAYVQEGEYDSVVSDNVEGACQAVRFLLTRGHRSIGFVGGSSSAYPSLRERREGFLRGLDFDLESRGYFADCGIDPVEVSEVISQLLGEHPEITALVGVNDEVAISAMRAAHTLGYQIPGDLSVVGFDDILLSSHVQPTLTTLRVDKINMGRLAVMHLINRSNNPSAAIITSTIHTCLVERESVADAQVIKLNCEMPKKELS
jgi:DNA-binding LacI/PurR family transcriptional regulator